MFSVAPGQKTHSQPEWGDFIPLDRSTVLRRQFVHLESHHVIDGYVVIPFVGEYFGCFFFQSGSSLME